MKSNQFELKELELDDLKNKDHIVDYYDGNIAIIDNISDLLTNVAPPLCQDELHRHLYQRTHTVRHQ